MAYDKIVDSAKLDADLTMVADAIRARAGTSEPLAFPEGMKDAVEGIPDLLELRLTNKLAKYSNSNPIELQNRCFAECSMLTEIDLPNATYLGTSAFEKCTGLTCVEFPKANYCNWTVFQGCTNLHTASFGTKLTLGAGAFKGCSALITVILQGATMSILEQTWVFENTPIESGSGYVYVPRALVDSYKSATNWSAFASQIRAIEDYPEITGG